MNASQSLLAAHVAVLAFGTTGILASLSGFDPWQVTSYRVVFGSAVLLLVLALRRQPLRMSPKTALICVAMGFWLSIHWYTFFLSMKLLGLMLGYAMTGTQPLLIALFARMFLGEQLTPRTKLALLISCLGFALLGASSPSTNLAYGLCVALLSYTMFAGLVVFNRAMVQKASPLWVTTLEMLGAIPLSLAFSSDHWLPQTNVQWGYALLLGVICTGFAYVLYNSAMKVLSAPLAGLLLCLEVVYGLIGGVALGDRLSALEWVAVALIANILVLDIVYYFKQRSAPLPNLN